MATVVVDRRVAEVVDRVEVARPAAVTSSCASVVDAAEAMATVVVDRRVAEVVDRRVAGVCRYV